MTMTSAPFKYFVCFFRESESRTLTSAILTWYPKDAYSVVGVESMALAIKQSACDRHLFEKHGWTIA